MNVEPYREYRGAVIPAMNAKIIRHQLNLFKLNCYTDKQPVSLGRESKQSPRTMLQKSYDPDSWVWRHQKLFAHFPLCISCTSSFCKLFSILCADFVSLCTTLQWEDIRGFGSLKHSACFEASNTAPGSIHSPLKETTQQTNKETELLLQDKWFCIPSVGKDMSEIWEGIYL